MNSAAVGGRFLVLINARSIVVVHIAVIA